MSCGSTLGGCCQNAPCVQPCIYSILLFGTNVQGYGSDCSSLTTCAQTPPCSIANDVGALNGYCESIFATATPISPPDPDLCDSVQYNQVGVDCNASPCAFFNEGWQYGPFSPYPDEFVPLGGVWTATTVNGANVGAVWANAVAYAFGPCDPFCISWIYDQSFSDACGDITGSTTGQTQYPALDDGASIQLLPPSGLGQITGLICGYCSGEEDPP